jgi:hypothetical protein
MDADEIGRLIARLAVAILAADGRITAAERAALGRLDDLGLGRLADVAEEEIEAALHAPIDVRATCAALPRLGDGSATLLLEVLAELAGTDRLLAPRERDVFDMVASHLGVDGEGAGHILAAAYAPAAAEPPPADTAPSDACALAFRILALAPTADRERIEAAYLELVQRFDPARIGELGAEFAALAVWRLAAITEAYETALASVSRKPRAGERVPSAGLGR